MKINQRGEACYSSFQELAEAYKIKPVQKTKQNEKAKQDFLKKHRCKNCGQALTFIVGTSVMTCCNPKCKGIKVSKFDEDGNESVSYMTSYNLLGDSARKFAENNF